ncbi:hypothetical protein [Methylosinus sp. Sm6]|uniref:hypothetical protein n=1 Tax=Methylosinus sp. Sm6 TaxID=2866948 RepID=UPI001C9A28B3|nr:hypothetical protein [Methylosinus sp. Sm6]MBY6241037.1 hypothetical protein [Methylosinus sp. Sm6]
MSLSLPTLSLPPVPKAVIDIMRLEAGPAALPTSRLFLAASLVAYTAGEIGQQLVSQDILPAIAYGLASVVLLVGATFIALLLAGARDRLFQTLAALATIGVVLAVVVVVLHSIVAQVFPPPLPTARLVNFLLFPLVLWKVTLFMWIYRHASLRFVPSLAVSVLYVGFTVFVLAPLLARAFSFL